MTSRDFCLWLQGYFELTQAQKPNDASHTRDKVDVLGGAQVECVRRHLALVFKHEIDPSMGTPGHQKQLKDIHWPSNLDLQTYCVKLTDPTDVRINC